MSLRAAPGVVVNTSRLHQYPILSLPSHLAQPSSPNPRPTKKQPSSTSTVNSSYLTSPASLPPSRFTRFLSSLQPLPSTAPLPDRDRAKHRVLSHLALTPATSALIDAALSHTHLEPLSSFTLSRCTGDAASVQQLLHGIASHSSLHRLDVHHCPAELHLPALIHCLPSLAALASFSLWGCDLSALTRGDMQVIATLPLLTSLDLSSTVIAPASLQPLASSLPSSPLTHLDLSNTGVDGGVAQTIAAALPSNTRLTSLVLHSNPLPPSALIALCQALAPNHTLTYLDLRWTAPLTATPTSPPVSLDLLLSALQANTTLLDLLLCGYADAVTTNVQSAIEVWLQRNRRRAEEGKGAGGGRDARGSTVEWGDNPLEGRKDVRVSPPLSYRSYSTSLCSTSPFSLTLDPPPPPPPLPLPPPPTVDSKLSSVVLQQEEEIARLGRICTRLRAMCKKQDDSLKATKAQLRKYRQASAPAAPPAEGVVPAGSPGASVTMRGSLSSEGADGGVEEGDEGGGGEFRVNLDLAATVVLLESQRTEQERLMEELRLELQQKPLTPRAPEAGGVGVGEDEEVPPPPSGPPPPTSASPPRSPIGSSAMRDELTHSDSSVEVARLRVQAAQLQAQLALLGSGSGVGVVGASTLRRDSGVHWASVVTAMKAESERVVREKEDKIQALLSAQRVLAESREVKAQQQAREWREKEAEWAAERERLQEETRRLRRRLHRLSLESGQGRQEGGSGRGSLKVAVQGGVRGLIGVGGEDVVRSPASASEDSSEESDEDTGGSVGLGGPGQVLSATQPLPGMGPVLPHKPAHGMGIVIAARIAAFEAKRGEESEVIREKMGMGGGRKASREAAKRQSLVAGGQAVEEEEKSED